MSHFKTIKTALFLLVYVNWGRQGVLFTTTALVCHSYSQQWTKYWDRANLLTVGESGSARPTAYLLHALIVVESTSPR